MKSFSLSKKSAIKRLFGIKSKMSSKNGKVGILKSHLVKQIWKLNLKMMTLVMRDGDAESLHCTGTFLA